MICAGQLQSRTWHRCHFCLGRILNNTQTFPATNRLQPSGTIFIRTGENHANDALPPNIGSTFEQNIGRWTDIANAVINTQSKARAPLDQHMVRGRSNVDAPALNRLPRNSRHRGQPAIATQDGSERIIRVRRSVLYHEYWQGKILIDRPEYDSNGSDAPGRRRNDDRPVSALSHGCPV